MTHGRDLGRTLVSGAVGALLLGGCLGGFTPLARVQESAQNLNTAARFGRMDIALENVGKDAREEFAKKHAAWGGGIRIMDSEVQGMALRDKEHADVYLVVGWQRPDESDTRQTMITQHWSDHRGTWLLASEERTGGDIGLLGEPTVVVRPATRSDVQFQSITIR